jgi:hypothetical protein
LTAINPFGAVGRLLARPSSAAWGFSGLVCFLTAAGYILVTILAVLVLASMATPGRRGTSPPAAPQRRDRLGPLSR